MGFYEILRQITKDLGSETFTKKDLVRVTGLNPRTIDRQISNLIKGGFVKVVVYRNNGEIEYQLSNVGDLNEFLVNVFGQL